MTEGSINKTSADAMAKLDSNKDSKITKGNQIKDLIVLLHSCNKGFDTMNFAFLYFLIESIKKIYTFL